MVTNAMLNAIAIGVLLFILKGIDQKVQKEEQEAARARGDYRADLGPEPDRKSEPVYGHDVPTEAQKSAYAERQRQMERAAARAQRHVGQVLSPPPAVAP